jgi:Family of unknown function (DUF6636)
VRRGAAVGVAAVFAAGVLASGANGADSRFFRLPSGNIGCAIFQSVLRCDIANGLRPRPPRPAGCELDWGFGLTLGRTGRARVVCAGDTVIDPTAPVLRYGSTWRRGGITCSSATSGLTCTNAAGRGFFLSRQSWRRL